MCSVTHKYNAMGQTASAGVIMSHSQDHYCCHNLTQ